MGTHPIFESDFDCLTESQKMKSGLKKFNSMLNRNIEEIQSHLEEIAHLKEKEIKLTRMKQFEYERKEADRQKHHHYRLRLSKQIRYYAKSGKLKFLRAVLTKAKEAELVNWKSQKGVTALHWAAKRGHEHVIEELIENGANPTMTTQYGQMPADLTRYKQLRIKLLVEAKKWNEINPIPAPPPPQPTDASDATSKKNSNGQEPMQTAIYSEMSEYIHSLKKL